MEMRNGSVALWQPSSCCQGGKGPNWTVVGSQQDIPAPDLHVRYYVGHELVYIAGFAASCSGPFQPIEFSSCQSHDTTVFTVATGYCLFRVLELAQSYSFGALPSRWAHPRQEYAWRKFKNVV